MISQRNEEARMVLAQLRQGTTMELAHESDKMFVVRKKIGDESLHKLLCFMLKVFQDSLKITNAANEMSATEIFEAADMLMGMDEGQYGRESIFDIIMALKHFKSSPFELYNAFSDTKLKLIMTNYLSVKSDFLVRINSQAGREATKKAPLTLEQVRAEYERSTGGQSTLGQQAAAERKEQQARSRLNWRDNDEYRKVLINRDWSQGYEVEDVEHEEVSETSNSENPNE